MLNIKSYLWRIISTTFLEKWVRNDFKKFLEWVREVDRDTKNIEVSHDKTALGCKICNSQLRHPFPKLREWIKLHRHNTFPKHLEWRNDKLFCSYCYPSHTEPQICFDPSSEYFFKDDNIKDFMNTHKHCVEIEFDFA